MENHTMSAPHPDRYFSPDPAVRTVARSLYAAMAALPLICPHGHVDPALFASPDARFGSPADLLIIPDHYVFRMLYSQGVTLESLGVPTQDGTPVETDHRAIWRRFAAHFHLFRATPTGLWLRDTLSALFGIDEKPDADNADALYDAIEAALATPEFKPRALFERFNIEVLATTDAAGDPLPHHRAIRHSGWTGRIVPTFRPDSVVNLDTPNWKEHLDRLSAASGVDIYSYVSFIEALENRRAYFRELGATATDHAALTAYTHRMTELEAEGMIQRALAGKSLRGDAAAFTAHMLTEMARMSLDDGMVMQLHVGSLRNHNGALHARFGNDKGADIPTRTDFVYGLKHLLDLHGNDPRLTLVVFTLDESTYARELAPLAGHYPALRLGPPWWFHDSLNGMARYFHQVMETAGLYNTTGFIDDTRAFVSIPARHDVWRRAAANWLAGLVVRGMIDMDEAAEMAPDMANGLARKTFKL
jgi:glucuronate isomerase